jgi:hypothetical protein
MEAQYEYMDRYKHTPPPEMTWHEFAGAVQRTDRYDIREQLRIAAGTILGQPVSEKNQGIRRLEMVKLERFAWPWRK